MLRALLFCLALLPLAGCELLGIRSSGDGHSRTIVIEGDEPFRLEIGDEAVLTDYDLSIQFTQIVEDSRCPANVECIWEGRAQVAFLMTQANREIAFTVTGFPNGRTGEGAAAAEVLGFRITLLELTPYPVFDVERNQVVRDGTPAVKPLVERVE